MLSTEFLTFAQPMNSLITRTILQFIDIFDEIPENYCSYLFRHCLNEQQMFRLWREL